MNKQNLIVAGAYMLYARISTGGPIQPEVRHERQ